MAKWIKVENAWLNVQAIVSLNVLGPNVAKKKPLFAVIVNYDFPIAHFNTRKEAEKFIQEFIDEHYLKITWRI